MVSDTSPAALPLLTADLPGTGGVIKEQPEDFRVEEIPLYEASGSGPHLYLTIEKRGISTHELIRRTARLLNVAHGDIGYAGLKDAQAVAVQRISVPERARAFIAVLEELDGVEVLRVEQHRNKLKPGHLKGNRFRIVIREVDEDAEARARAILDVLERRGVPNGFDTQRFGNYGNSHRLGRLLLHKDPEGFSREFLAPEGLENREEILDAIERRDCEALPEIIPAHRGSERRFAAALEHGPAAALRNIEKRMRKFYLTAFQAYLFNLTLERRGIHAIDELWEGDLAYLHRNGAVFTVQDVETERPRLATFEISPSGPLPGRKAPLAEGKQGEIERSVAEKEGALPEAFREKRLGLPGDRRPYRVPFLEPPEARRVAKDALLISFAFPPGAYATALTREIMTSIGEREAADGATSK